MANISSGGGGGDDSDSTSSSSKSSDSGSMTSADEQVVNQLKDAQSQAADNSGSSGNTPTAQDEQVVRELKQSQQTSDASTATSSGSKSGSSASDVQAPRGAKRAVKQDKQRSANVTSNTGTNQPQQRRGESKAEVRRAAEAAGVSGAGRAVNQTPTAVRDLTSQQPGAGVEKGEGRAAAQARNLERSVVADVPGVESTSQVRVKEQGDKLVAELTTEGEEAATQAQKEKLEAEAMAQFDRATSVNVSETETGLVATPNYGASSSPQQIRRGQVRAANETPQPAKNFVNTKQTDAFSPVVESVEDATNLDVPGSGSYTGKLAAQATGEVSPIVQMGIEDSERLETARAGEQQIEKRGAEGDAGARIFTGGEVIQNVGGDVGDAVESGTRALLNSPAQRYLDPAGIGDEQLPVVSGESGATANAQVASAAGGVAEFPFLVAGGTAQAVGVTSMSQGGGPGTDASRVASNLEDTTTTATERQASLVTDRPVEAGLIFGTPLALRGAKARGRAGAIKSRLSGKSKSTRLVTDGGRSRLAVEKARVRRFVEDTRGQQQLAGKQKSKGKSRGEPVENVKQIDPRELGKGIPEGRSKGMETAMGTRPARRSLSGRQSFAQDVRAVKKLKSETPSKDLRVVTEMDAKSGTKPVGVASAQGTAATLDVESAELLEQAQRQEVLEEATRPKGVQERTQLYDLEDATRSKQTLQMQLKQEQSLQEQAQQSEVLDAANETAGGTKSTGQTKGRPNSRGKTKPAEPASDTQLRSATTARGITNQESVTGERADVEAPPVTGETVTTTQQTPTSPPPTSPPSTSSTPNFPRAPPSGLPPIPQGGGRGPPRPDVGFRNTKIVSNPVAAPSEFSDAAESIGFGGKKNKKRKRDSDELYDIFSAEGNGLL